MPQPLVAVSADSKHFENHTWHAVPGQYLEAAVSVAGVFPVLVPAFGEKLDIGRLLSCVDGVMLTGSKSNVHPANYGGEATDKHGPFDEARDTTTLHLIRRAIEAGVPLLAICRGIQELNVALGGTLAADIHEIDGRLDHRGAESASHDERFALGQTVRIEPAGRLAGIFEAAEITVNSVHRQAIDRLAPGLAVEAVAPDGTVEAVSVKDAPAFALGVQWHPEYWAKTDGNSARIFRAFGDAVRAHAAAREGTGAAAEGTGLASVG